MPIHFKVAGTIDDGVNPVSVMHQIRALKGVYVNAFDTKKEDQPPPPPPDPPPDLADRE
jgi:hypothetical protein